MSFIGGWCAWCTCPTRGEVLPPQPRLCSIQVFFIHFFLFPTFFSPFFFPPTPPFSFFFNLFRPIPEPRFRSRSKFYSLCGSGSRLCMVGNFMGFWTTNSGFVFSLEEKKTPSKKCQNFFWLIFFIVGRILHALFFALQIAALLVFEKKIFYSCPGSSRSITYPLGFFLRISEPPSLPGDIYPIPFHSHPLIFAHPDF